MLAVCASYAAAAAAAAGRGSCSAADDAELPQAFFAALTAPIGPAEFLANYYDKTPVVLNGSAHGRDFSDWIQLADLTALIDGDADRAHRRVPDAAPPRWGADVRAVRLQQGTVRLWGQGADQTKQLPDRPATAAEVKSLWDEGWTIVVRHAHAWWRPILAVSSLLEQYLETTATANVYLTPPGSTGFALHFDAHGVFVCQTEGAKEWRVYDPIAPNPISEHQPPEGITAEGDPVLAAVLRPGDCLYIPQGFLHEGSALPGVPSTHLTLSPQGVPWSSFLRHAGLPYPPGRNPGAAARRLTGAAARRSLPLLAAAGIPAAFRERVPPRLGWLAGAALQAIIAGLLAQLPSRRPRSGRDLGPSAESAEGARDSFLALQLEGMLPLPQAARPPADPVEADTQLRVVAPTAALRVVAPTAARVTPDRSAEAPGCFVVVSTRNPATRQGRDKARFTRSLAEPWLCGELRDVLHPWGTAAAGYFSAGALAGGSTQRAPSALAAARWLAEVGAVRPAAAVERRPPLRMLRPAGGCLTPEGAA